MVYLSQLMGRYKITLHRELIYINGGLNQVWLYMRALTRDHISDSFAFVVALTLLKHIENKSPLTLK